MSQLHRVECNSMLPIGCKDAATMAIRLATAVFIAVVLEFCVSTACNAMTVVNTPIGPQTEAKYMTFCNVCTTPSTFQDAALGYWKVSNLRGDQVTEVINENTAQEFFVEIVYQPADSPNYGVGPAVPGQTGDQAIVNAIIGIWYKHVFLQVKQSDFTSEDVYGTTGFESFDDWSEDQTCPGIYNALTTDPSTQPSQSFWSIIGNFIEDPEELVDRVNPVAGLPTVTVVFLNGDVAQFTLASPESNDVCHYVAGTARNSQGLFIDDSGLGGDGISNGSGYLKATGSNSFNLEMNNDLYYACTRAGGGGWDCEYHYY